MPNRPRRRLQLAVWAALLLASPPGRLPAQPPDDLAIESVAGGLSFPVAVRHAGDGSGRLFVVEQAGTIRVFDGMSLLPVPFLDIEDKVFLGGEEGLLGLAFHPDYGTNGCFYVYYTREGGTGLYQAVVERYSVSAGDPDVADPDSDSLVLAIDHDFLAHNGGDVHFGPDGYLYVGTGDGGDFANAQDLGSLLGKMLRIDIDGGTPYAIPPDNPFVGDPSARDEIWAYGLRNPWRWSFDRRTGDLLIGDVGESDWEEVDYQTAASSGGENYGWPCREGAHDHLGGCTGPLVDPVLEYSHDGGGCTVIGGYVYRGSIQGLAGTYVYNDWCTGTTWFATRTGAVWTSSVWGTVPGFSVVGYGEDEAGELYLVLGSDLARFVSPSSAGHVFSDGFESGDTSGW